MEILFERMRAVAVYFRVAQRRGNMQFLSVCGFKRSVHIIPFYNILRLVGPACCSPVRTYGWAMSKFSCCTSSAFYMQLMMM